MRNKIIAAAMTLLSLGAVLTTVASAADYPNKPIELLCPYTPGGSFDVMSRLVAEIATKHLGQPVVVVNKPGAGGSLAAAEVIGAKADGYKLVTLANVFFATTTKTQKLPFDPNDLVPLANFMEIKVGLMVRGDSPFKTFNDLIEYARRNPGQLKWGHAGRGVTTHMSTLTIFKKAGVKTIDVPFKGTPEGLTAILGGHVDAGSFPYGAAVDHVKAGKIRYLVFFTDSRYSDPPDVPTAAELGYPDAILPTYVGLYVHKNTPDEIRKILTEACRKTYDDQELRKGIEKLGENPKAGGPEFIAASIKKMEEVGIPILKEIGLYVGN